MILFSSISYSQINNIIIPIKLHRSTDGISIIYSNRSIKNGDNTNEHQKIQKRNGLKYYLESVKYYKKDSLNHLYQYKYNDFAYDNNGYEISDLEYVKNGNIAFKKNKKIIKTYDSNGNLIQIITYNGNVNSWVKHTKHEFTYDTNRNVLNEKRFLWNGSWKKFINRSYSYNSNNLVTSIEKLLWNDNKNKWIGDTINDYFRGYLETYPKQEYTYFSDGKKKSEIIYTYNFENDSWKYYAKFITDKLNNYHYRTYCYSHFSNNWELSSFEDMEYATKNNIMFLKKASAYDSDNNNRLFWQFYMDIDSLGNTISFKGESSLQNNTWIVTYKDLRNYDTNHNIISDEFYNNNSLVLDEVWGFGSYSKNYNYDANENVESYIHHDWDMDNQRWQEKIKNTYTYDCADTITDIVLTETFYDIVSEFYIPNYVVSKPRLELLKYRVLTHDTYTLKNNTWDLSERIEFVYSRADFLESASIDQLDNIKLFPNRARNKVHILFDAGSDYILSLYSIVGKKINNNLINYKKSEIDISKLNKGMYILKATNTCDGKVSTLKFIKD
jgi:hypothetical protein